MLHEAGRAWAQRGGARSIAVAAFPVTTRTVVGVELPPAREPVVDAGARGTKGRHKVRGYAPSRRVRAGCALSGA